MSKKIILFIATFLFCLNIVAWQEVFSLSAQKYLMVNFLDVGQGDSMFIQTPEGHQILIDGGPDGSLISKMSSLMPFWDKDIDLVILTHPEKDHMTGILDVLERYKVDYFLWTGVVKDDAGNKKLTKLLERVKTKQSSLLLSLNVELPTKVVTANAGEKIVAGNTIIEILYPFEDLAGKEIKKSANDTCIVSKVVYGESSFLLTCDIDSVVEKKLVYNNSDIVSDVLKVAHHGSKYSTSNLFLENVKPDFAVIEVGRNSYGHPTPEVLQRLEKSGIKVLRTDKDGDVKFVSDGNSIKLINN